jgi:glycosyltransferase involved in cell wall biosynthesis
MDEKRPVFFQVDPAVQLLFEDLNFGISSKGNKLTRKIAFWKHIQRLRYLLKQINAAVVIGTEYHFSIAATMLNRNNQFRVYAWEHHHFHELEKNFFWNFLFRKYYPKLNAVICLNTDEASLFAAMGTPTVVIPNFISQQTLMAQHNKRILTVARLSRVKGIDRLIQIAPPVLKKHPDWRWLMVGEGPMKEALEKMISENGLEKQLEIQSPSGPDLSAIYSQSSIYVMTSRNECFPMVLLEAMSYGLPCIAFDCETGPRHIIKDKENGRLVRDGDVMQMVDVIDAIIIDPEKITNMGNQAHSSMAAFAPEVIYKKWMQLLIAEY